MNQLVEHWNEMAIGGYMSRNPIAKSTPHGTTRARSRRGEGATTGSRCVPVVPIVWSSGGEGEGEAGALERRRRRRRPRNKRRRMEEVLELKRLKTTMKWKGICPGA